MSKNKENRFRKFCNIEITLTQLKNKNGKFDIKIPIHSIKNAVISDKVTVVLINNK